MPSSSSSPPRVELINTGSELLLGRTLNSHMSWLGAELFSCGLRLSRQVTISDGPEIGEELRRSLQQNEVVLVTGGLGPTSDDLTLERTAEVLKLPLHHHHQSWQNIQEYMQRRGRQATEAQKRQALIPEKATVLANYHGTAPGLLFFEQGLEDFRAKALVLLPGPPSELRPMFTEQVAPTLQQFALQQRMGEALQMAEWKIAGIGESELIEILKNELDTWEQQGLEIGYCARLGEVDLRLIGPAQALQQAGPILANKLGDALVGPGEMRLEELLVETLSQRGETLALAESCTGGLLAQRITSVAGSSAVFQYGLVAYANQIKASELGIAEEILTEHGAVSQAVVEAMAKGAAQRANADWALSISGIAGPQGGSEQKPVGTVWIGLHQATAKQDLTAPAADITQSKRFQFRGSRERIRLAASQTAFDWLRRELHSSPPD